MPPPKVRAKTHSSRLPCRRGQHRRCPPPAKIEIQDGRVKLEHIFLARLWSSELRPQDLVTLTYKKPIEVAGAVELQGELCLT
jgi:hypothetical protein